RGWANSSNRPDGVSVSILSASWQRLVPIKRDTIRNACNAWIALRQNGTASLECHLQEETVKHRDSHVLKVEVRSNISVFRITECRQWLFRAGREHRVQAYDRVLRCQLIVGHLDHPILSQHGLEAINGWRPGEVLDPTIRFSQIPGDNHPISELLHVALAGHARLEENAERRNVVDERAGGFM